MPQKNQAGGIECQDFHKCLRNSLPVSTALNMLILLILTKMKIKYHISQDYKSLCVCVCECTHTYTHIYIPIYTVYMSKSNFMAIIVIQSKRFTSLEISQKMEICLGSLNSCYLFLARNIQTQHFRTLQITLCLSIHRSTHTLDYNINFNIFLSSQIYLSLRKIILALLL